MCGLGQESEDGGLVSALSSVNIVHCREASFMRFLLIGLLLLLVAVLSFHALFSYDVFTHLAAGRFILDHRAVPALDPFSYTIADRPWIDHEWLFQLILYPLYLLGGVSALNLFRVLLVLALFTVLLLSLERRPVHLLVLFVLLAAAMSSYTRFQMRPELLSFLFLALTLVILKRFDADPSTRLLYLLPLIQLLWVNTHGLFILGPLVLLVFILGRFLSRHTPAPFAWTLIGGLSVVAGLYFAAWTPADAALYSLPFLAAVVASLILSRKRPPNPLPSSPAFPRLFLTLALVTLVCFINPYTWKLALYPFTVLSQLADRSSLIYSVGELVPTLSFATLAQTFWFKLFSLIVLLSFVLNFRRVRPWTALLVGLTFPFALAALRNTPVFAVVGALAASLNFSDWWTANSPSLLVIPRSPRARSAASLALQTVLALLILFLTFNVVTDRMNVSDRTGLRFGSGLSQTKFSEPAMSFVRDNRLQGPLFNNLAAGGMCAFFLPSHRTFIDGRIELFGPDMLALYRSIMLNPDSFRAASRTWPFNTVLLTKGSYDGADLAVFLYRSPDWRLVYMDSASWVFARKIPAHARVISLTSDAFNFAAEDSAAASSANNPAPPYPPVPPSPRGTFDLYLIDLDWFRRLGFLDLAEGRLETLLAFYPDVPDVHYAAAVVYQSQGYRLKTRTIPALPPGSAHDAATSRMELYFKRTVESYDRVARLQPAYPGLHFSIATFYANIGDLPRARVALDQSLRTEYHSRSFLLQCAQFAQTRLRDPALAEKLSTEADHPLW